MNHTAKVQLLLVEDNPMDAMLVQRLLENLDQELPVATHLEPDAETALAELQRNPYDLILLDYQLPGASGLDLLAEIDKLPKSDQPAVIMLTATGNEAVAVEAMKRGAKDYLRKDDLAAPSLTRAVLSALTQKRMQDQLTRYHTQIETDLRMARQLQHAMLPQHFPLFPSTATAATSALQFHARYISTVELGGDFYDVFPLSDTTAGVFICDVMGHGVRAALVTAMIRALIEEFQFVAHDPSQFLTGINHALLTLLKRMDDPLFATACYLIVDVAHGELRYATAGHPLPFHLPHEPGTVAVLPPPTDGLGPALGLFDGAAYPAAHHPLAAQDLVLLFTDGLFEVLDDHDNEFGEDRLLAAAREHRALPPPQLLDQLINQCRTYSATGEFADDVCLIAVEATKLIP